MNITGNNRAFVLDVILFSSFFIFGGSFAYAEPVEMNFFWADTELHPSDPDYVDIYPNITMRVGDTIEFTYGVIHNVYIHPTNDCTQIGSIKVGGALDSPASYTFTEDDLGKEIFFSCDRDIHCENGQNMIVTVASTDSDITDEDEIQSTPAPTPPPTFPLGDGGSDGFAICFAGDTLVDVMDERGTIKVENLKLGDMVHIGNNKYSKVYSFGHKESSIKAEYIQIHTTAKTKPLKLSKNHMIFVVDGNNHKAVPSFMIKPGDELILTTGNTTNRESAIVTKTTLTSGKGAFAPFTMSGTIAVNGILASNYVSLQQQESDTLMIFGGTSTTNWKTSISMQWLSHAFQAHHRLVCSLSTHFCKKETYAQNGISNWVYGPLIFFCWILSQPQWILVLVTPFIVGTAICLSAIEEFVTIIQESNTNSLLLPLSVVSLLLVVVVKQRKMRKC
mmetsp:Transcript_22807/g.25990  ORF Transcript_22807/g.25990 Transcript_22807/m.25990 type:complete len:448 (+) Transcript_22807:276-1619(+)